MSQLKTATNRIILSTALLSSVAMSSAINANAQSSSAAQFNYTAPLSLMSIGGDKAELNTTLDWRKTSHNFTFELPAANLTDDIELLLSANPRSGVNPFAPLTVQFNDDEPVLLNVNGQGFDARIKLDKNKARSAQNIIRVNYGAQPGADCIAPQDGGWDIDLRTSKIAIHSRAKRRSLQFREIDKFLTNSGLAPRRVNLVAAGPNATQLQALAAQGIGLRMAELPDFSTDSGNSDFEIIMARRAELYQYIQDDKLIEGRGAAIIIPRGRPVKLIFTGDTEDEILAGVKSFAQRDLPKARRSATSLGEMRLQTPLKSGLVRLSTTQALIDLPNSASFSNWAGDDWASGSKSLRFDVTDPKAMTGEILLRLASSKNVSPNSKLSVKLNGESLGLTVLDKRRKSVAFEIKPGTLRGKDNLLTLSPQLNPNETPSCNAVIGPNFHLGRGSKIVLNTQTPSAPTELSLLTATAMPFSDEDGAQSYIAMPGSRFDFNTSLKVLARIAKTSGEGLVGAKYSRNVNLDETTGKHVLFIGPSDRLPAAVLQGAPRALSNALRGQAFEGDNLISANIERFASLDANDSFKLAAQRLSQSRRIQAGGVAALFPSPNSDAHIIGVITNTPGQSFNVSADRLTQAPYWAELTGGVARWNDGSVLSVQAAQDVPGYAAVQQPQSAKLSGLKLDMAIFDDAFNSASDISQKLWDGLSGFSHEIAKKLKNLTAPNEAANGNEAPTITKPEAGDTTSVETAINRQNSQGLGQTAQNALHAANDWASTLGTKIRQSLNPNQSFIRQMLHPIPLLMVSLFLILLFNLIFSRKPSRKRLRN